MKVNPSLKKENQKMKTMIAFSLNSQTPKTQNLYSPPTEPPSPTFAPLSLSVNLDLNAPFTTPNGSSMSAFTFY
jgi:hypothetical protein